MRNLWILALTLAGGCSAAPLSYLVSLNTAPLIGNAAGPFSIDLQLVGDQGTVATVGSFGFDTGSPTGTGNCFGNCTGDLSSAVTLSATSGFFNEFFQTFLPGNLLNFTVTFAGINPPPPAGPDSPDGFSFAILDSSLNEIAMLSGNGSFLTVTLDDVNSPSMVTYENDPATGIGSMGTPTVQQVSSTPEPASALLLGLGLAGVWASRRYRPAR